MKHLYLIYNEYTNNFIYVEGDKLEYNRHEWKERNSGLIKKLKSVLNPKRKSVLFLENIPEEAQYNIINYLNGTKIRVELKNSL